MRTPASTDSNPWLPFWRLSALLVVQIGFWSQWTWQKWPDVLIDFGREWSVPARMLEGEVLYRDIAYFNGPLSPVTNTFVFSLGGPTLASLWVANLFVLTVFSITFMWLLRQVVSLNTACLTVSIFLALCGFQQYIAVGNYNWIAPYSHEMTHGLLLSVLTLLAASRFLQTGSRAAVGLAGLGCGMVALTKCELTIALLGGGGVLFAARSWEDWRNGRQRNVVFRGCVFIVSLCLPTVLAWMWWSRFLPVGDAMSSVLGSWTHLGNRELTNSPFYRQVMGTADWPASLTSMFGWSVIQAIVLGVAVFWGHSSLSPARERRRAALVGLSLVAGLAVLGSQLDWLSMPRPWPLLIGVLVVCTVQQVFRASPGDPENEMAGDSPVARRRLIVRLALLVWSGLLLLKILLFCRVFHYGFALAAPALAVVVCAGWEWWPQWLARRGRSPLVARAGVLALTLAGLFSHLWIASKWNESRTIRVGSGPNRILAGPRGELVNSLLADLEELVPSDATLLCLPEGAMINMFAERRSSSRYLNFVPADMQMFGEDRMLDDLRNHPPDWIAFINRDTSEYGPAVFGIDYAEDVGRWMTDHYEIRRQAGQDMTSARSGYTLLQRRTAP